MSVPTQNSLNDRVNELEAVVYGAQVIGGSPALGVRGTGATNLSGSADVLTFPLPENEYYVSSSGVDAMTIAAPNAGAMSAGGDDTKRVTVTDVGGHAHTITAPSNTIVPSHHLATFGGTAGATITLEAFGGLWYPKPNTGVTVS